MKTVTVPLKNNAYPVVIGASLSNLGGALRALRSKNSNFSKNVLVVTHPFLKAHYGSLIGESLKKIGFHVEFAVLPQGERVKNLEFVRDIYDRSVQAKLNRNSFLIAFGGGVIGDTAGFAAATYMRGIPFVQVPTTLLAMVDSSVGGKVGVDLPSGKNLVGSFYQPRLVWCDISILKTLPLKEYTNGLAEVIKVGVIADPAIFERLERELPSALDLEWIISRCVQVKATVVSKDEKESKGIREILNFGHTIGHAIETMTSYKTYTHGEAISIGMRAAGEMATHLKIFDRNSFMRLEKLISKAGLPSQLKEKLVVDRLLKLLYRDKKVFSKNLRFVLPVRIGKVVVMEVSKALALKGLESIQPYF